MGMKSSLPPASLAASLFFRARWIAIASGIPPPKMSRGQKLLSSFYPWHCILYLGANILVCMIVGDMWWHVTTMKQYRLWMIFWSGSSSSLKPPWSPPSLSEKSSSSKCKASASFPDSVHSCTDFLGRLSCRVFFMHSSQLWMFYFMDSWHQSRQGKD